MFCFGDAFSSVGFAIFMLGEFVLFYFIVVEYFKRFCVFFFNFEYVYQCENKYSFFFSASMLSAFETRDSF